MCKPTLSWQSSAIVARVGICPVSWSQSAMARAPQEIEDARHQQEGGAGDGIRTKKVERETGFEPATFCLGSLPLVSVVARA